MLEPRCGHVLFTEPGLDWFLLAGGENRAGSTGWREGRTTHMRRGRWVSGTDGCTRMKWDHGQLSAVADLEHAVAMGKSTKPVMSRQVLAYCIEPKDTSI